MISDNGLQFVSSEFKKFSKEWDLEQRTSSPGNSKSNGKVESAVKTAKNLIRKALDAGTDPYLAILNYRNTPTQGMESSPVQRLMNRRTRTLLPTTKALLEPRTSHRCHHVSIVFIYRMKSRTVVFDMSLLKLNTSDI